jgi:hypothetical protein
MFLNQEPSFRREGPRWGKQVFFLINIGPGQVAVDATDAGTIHEFVISVISRSMTRGEALLPRSGINTVCGDARTLEPEIECMQSWRAGLTDWP